MHSSLNIFFMLFFLFYSFLLLFLDYF